MLALLFYINHGYSQIICNLGSQQNVYQTTSDEEYSGLAYHEDLDIFIMPTDDPIASGIHFKGVNSDGTSFNISLAANSFLDDNDLEGLTYLDGDFFVLAEEDENKIYFLQFNYNANNENNSTFTIINSQSLIDEIPLADNKAIVYPNNPNKAPDGIEGVSYDPVKSMLYLIREWGDTELFSFQITIPTDDGNGNVLTTGNVVESSVSSFNLTTAGFITDNVNDASGLFHLGKTYAGSSSENHILILGEEENAIREFKLTYTDPQNNDFSILDLDLVGITYLNENQPEGIAVHDGEVYIASEKGSGSSASLSFYSINSIALDLKVFLEGPYNSSTGQHLTALNTGRGLLPGQTPTSTLPGVVATPAGQPYSAAPWNYAGTEGDSFTDNDYLSTDVDWVLVSLRSGVNINTTYLRAAGILQTDGTIRFPDCISSTTNQQPAYIVIEHRNHLPVMSNLLANNNVLGNILTYDFTTADSFTVPASFGQKLLVPGNPAANIPDVWAAYAGNIEQGNDFTQRDDINAPDKWEWKTNEGVFDIYFSGDANLSGDNNGADKTLWFNNNGIATRVNHPSLQ